jgi:uncharacterized membrane protein YfcA
MIDLVPPDLSPLVFWGLVAASFLTSGLTAAFGLGGGMALIAIMANLMPVAALVPVHGVVQIGSNAGRVLIQIRHVNWPILGWYAAGAIAGAALGGSIAVTLPAWALRLGIGLFVLWIIWGKAPDLGSVRRRALAATGFVATTLSMFFGAAGPIGGAILSKLGLNRRAYVGTQAATALAMHLLKIAAFGFLGFAFAPWIGLIAAMIASGFLGTLAGSRLLGRMDERTFKKGFRVVMTAMGLVLVARGVVEAVGT